MMLLLLSHFSHVWLCATPWTAAHQSSLSITNSWSCSNSCSLNWWCHSTISSSVMPFSSSPSIFPNIRVFSNELALRIRWPRYWSFSISHPNEYSGLISFRIDWLDLLDVQGDTQESSPAPKFKSINSSMLSLLYGPTLISIHNYWKNHSFDCMDLCWQSDVSVFYYSA